jgi:hypothetical protein
MNYSGYYNPGYNGALKVLDQRLLMNVSKQIFNVAVAFNKEHGWDDDPNAL